jgi:hypothetical protein
MFLAALFANKNLAVRIEGKFCGPMLLHPLRLIDFQADLAIADRLAICRRRWLPIKRPSPSWTLTGVKQPRAPSAGAAVNDP